MELLLNLLKVSLVAGAAAALLTALKPILGRRYHAKWRYWVWLCLAALLLTPLLPSLPLALPAEQAPIQVEVPALSVTYEAGRGLALQPQSLPTPVPAAGNVENPTDAGEPAPSLPEASAPAAPAASAAETALPLETVLLIPWAAGAVLFLLWQLAGTAILSRRAMAAARPPSGSPRRWKAPW